MSKDVYKRQGLDTVNLNGEGFQVEVQPKTHVRAGERLMRFSREQIQTAGYPDGVVVIVTNARLFKQVETCLLYTSQ